MNWTGARRTITPVDAFLGNPSAGKRSGPGRDINGDERNNDSCGAPRIDRIRFCGRITSRGMKATTEYISLLEGRKGETVRRHGQAEAGRR
jgi:hypothetical protein